MEVHLSHGTDNAIEVQPVVLQRTMEKKTASYNPTAIERCLRKCIGVYSFRN